MEVREAVKKAMEYFSEVFAEERPGNIGLEEVVLNDETDAWEITVGFSRPWDYQPAGLGSSLYPKPPTRQYKVVMVDNATGAVKSIKIREQGNA
jgi:hypothetical protein